jgi:anhydro-N-acetylmuramic acid kinase
VTHPDSEKYLGLISGTSVDAIDAVLVEFAPRPRLLAQLAHAYPAELRKQILDLGLGRGNTTLQCIGALDVTIGKAFAAAALDLLSKGRISAGSVRAIGSHGQTVWHAPRDETPFTTQLGDPNVIAEHTGIDTVADFRRRDVAAGGEGAPLVPAFHAAFLHSSVEHRAVLNLGGIANLTLLPRQGPVRGFDTGPANTLMDLWVEKHTALPYDAAGAFAATGSCHAELLKRMLEEPFFALGAPKSTGRDYFNMTWLSQRLDGLAEVPAQDVQATLLELTAQTVAIALRREAPDTECLIVCGGGARNGQILRAIAASLPGVRIETSDHYGLDPDYMEAMAFAWLARETINGRPGNLAAVTGARGPRILGGIYRA